MVTLIAKDVDGVYTQIDLSEELSISLNKSVDDIEDITARTGAYTKTFEIPGTARNNKFFGSVFNINATDFDSTLNTDCVIQYGGSDVFIGNMRLNKIIVTNRLISYEVYLVENLTSFAAQLDESTMCDLDFDDIIHDVDYDTIKSTWTYTGGTYDSYSGITGKVLYPLAQTGYDEGQTYGLFNFTTSGFTNSGATAIQTTQFKPWVNVKYIMDKIFEKADFTYESNFFDTQYFKSIFMYAGQSPTMGAQKLDDRPENQNYFQVRQQAGYYYTFSELNSGYKYVILDRENYDYLDRYTLSTFPTVPGQTGAKNYFTAPISGDYQFRLELRDYQVGQTSGPSYVDYALVDIDTGSVIYVNSGIPIPVGAGTDRTLYFNGTLTQNQRVAVKIRYNGGIPADIGISGAKFTLYSSPTLSVTGTTIQWVDNLPCSIQNTEFVKNILNYFNCVLIPTGSRSFLIEPYKDYLSSSSGSTYDWTQKLNLDETYTVEPLDFTLINQLNFKYVDDGSFLGKSYKETYDTNFGDYEFISSNTLLSGSQDIESIFQSLPTNTIDDQPDNDFVVPHLYQKDKNTENIILEQPYSSEPRLGFYCGEKIPYTGTGTTQISWYMQSGTTVVEQTKYPVISHLSELSYTASTSDISEINFGSDYDYFMKNNDLVGYSDNTVFNDFYDEYLEALYSTEARLFEGIFYLTPEDINDIQFNDKVYFLNSQWRLLNIEDGDITTPSMVRCKFLKVPYRTISATPIPPNYERQSQARPTPLPTPTPPSNTLYWYFEELMGAGFANIEFEELEVTQVANSTQLFRTTSLGSGSASFFSGYLRIYGSFTYKNNVGSINNLELTFGSSSGDDSYGRLAIPQPADNTFYELDVEVYFPASGNLYATFDTY